MGTLWRPEREVTILEARDAIASTGYDGPLRSVDVVAAGWDTTVVLVDDDWVFRFPRREITHLPGLAEKLLLPVPRPPWVGTIGEPAWPFSGVGYLGGDELAARPEVDRVSVRSEQARTVLADLIAFGLSRGDAYVEAVLAAADALEPSRATPVHSHGDLHSRHAVVDAAGRVSGIIDRGDLCLAPPSVDLAIAYSAFSGPVRPTLFRKYGPVDDETRPRARTMADFSAVAIALYAHDTGAGEGGGNALLKEALHGLAGIAEG